VRWESLLHLELGISDLHFWESFGGVHGVLGSILSNFVLVYPRVAERAKKVLVCVLNVSPSLVLACRNVVMLLRSVSDVTLTCGGANRLFSAIETSCLK